MEKRTYVKPVLSGEEFVPQNYIAACGDSGAVYKFKCDARAGYMYVPDPNNSNSYLVKRQSYTPCAETHETPVADTYYDGFIDRNGNRTEDAGEEVKVYLEFNRWGSIIDGHATENVKMETWDISKS